MFGISEEERKLGRRYIIATSAKKVLEHDIKKVDETDLKLSSVYKEMMVQMSNQVSYDLRNIRSEMAKIGLRVTETRPGEHLIHCGGNEFRSYLDRVRMKNLVTEYLTELNLFGK